VRKGHISNVVERAIAQFRFNQITIIAVTVRENVCNNSKNVKSHVFLDFEKKRIKNVRIVSQAT